MCRLALTCSEAALSQPSAPWRGGGTAAPGWARGLHRWRSEPPVPGRAWAAGRLGPGVGESCRRKSCVLRRQCRGFSGLHSTQPTPGRAPAGRAQGGGSSGRAGGGGGWPGRAVGSAGTPCSLGMVCAAASSSADLSRGFWRVQDRRALLHSRLGARLPPHSETGPLRRQSCAQRGLSSRGDQGAARKVQGGGCSSAPRDGTG